MDCGPTCLKMVCKFHGKEISIKKIKEIAGYNKEGVNLLGLSDAAAKLGFKTNGLLLNYDQLISEIQFPAILHWEQNHFVIISKIYRTKKLINLFYSRKNIEILDPAIGLIKLTKNEFLDKWVSGVNEENISCGIVLNLQPTKLFFELKKENKNILDWNLVLKNLKGKEFQLIKISFTLVLASLIQFTFPFLTQILVDKGINKNDLKFVTIVLFGQLMLMTSKFAIDYFRARILLKISTHINLSLLKDFWFKLIKLPISYFELIHTGDIIQRINDNKEIQKFLTSASINTFFSIFGFIIFSFMLLNYDLLIFSIFLTGSLLYTIWIKLFLHIRRGINYRNFHLFSKENNATLQLVQGMKEIRLNGAEQIKALEWIEIQSQISRLNLKNLSYTQLQQTGALLISQGKDIIITFIVSKLVIEGGLSFGGMLAIQYIIGQLNSPIEQFITFIQSAQDAKISLERLNEVYELDNEEKNDFEYINFLPENKNLIFKDFSFKYPGNSDNYTLKNLNFVIEHGKTTAIVGMSGSGKTTILKLLLKFYENYTGDFMIGENKMNSISSIFWRNQCGAVMQDGYIFNDTIAKNIAVNGIIDPLLLDNAVKKANILDYINSLPNGFNTILGDEGVGLSQGQKQRIFIARAIYKNPQFILFDEATNALDSNNERAIVENIQNYFLGKTVVIVAHRLSTVKNADKIVVMKDGCIVEVGTHSLLLKLKGHYFELVKNQLDLGV